MNKIENLRIIKHFKDNVKGDIHGIYECNVNEKKMLLVRHGMEIASISFFIGKPLGECIMNVRKDIAMDIEKEVDSKLNSKRLKTQLDKIMEMDNNELSRFINSIGSGDELCGCMGKEFHNSCANPDLDICAICVREWLNSEVAE